MDYLEAFAIRFLWVLYALRPTKTPGLCPPQCAEMHTYKWPCRGRIKRVKNSKLGAYYDMKH